MEPKLSQERIEELALSLVAQVPLHALHHQSTHLVLNQAFTTAVCGVLYPTSTVVGFPYYRDGKLIHWQLQPPSTPETWCPDCEAVFKRANMIILEREKS